MLLHIWSNLDKFNFLSYFKLDGYYFDKDAIKELFHESTKSSTFAKDYATMIPYDILASNGSNSYILHGDYRLCTKAVRCREGWINQIQTEQCHTNLLVPYLGRSSIIVHPKEMYIGKPLAELTVRWCVAQINNMFNDLATEYFENREFELCIQQ